jgi:serine O-acetyltransferase
MGVVIGETAIIGDDCSIYHGVTLGGTTTTDKGKRHPTLESGVIIGAGAKVLGPIVLGTGVKVGSNAVVVKDVPAGATVVGIPGHIVSISDDKDQQLEAQRHAMAKKIGFDAYGPTRDMPDPIQNAIDTMLDHMHKIEKELEELKTQVRSEK